MIQHQDEYYYTDLANPQDLPRVFKTGDHFGGFTENFENPVFETLNNYAIKHDFVFTIETDQFFPRQVTDLYTGLDIKFDIEIFKRYSGWNQFEHYTTHPKLTHENFICSFNSSPHVSRQLLVALLHRFGWFSPDVCSKNFVCSADTIDGHINQLLPQSHRLYRRFFLSESSDDFLKTDYSIGEVLLYDHRRNIYNLENHIASSFLHVVSESLATSYVPFVTEKFLYSVVTRGLFLAYAQPGWHRCLTTRYGFHMYDRIFDYTFDDIKNPVVRLVELLCMISKFSILSRHDWHDLYELEKDTIEHNRDHYYSGKYLEHLSSHA